MFSDISQFYLTIQSRDVFRPIARKLYYLMDYKLGYLSLDIICSWKLKVYLELRSQKTVRFSQQIMFADKYPIIFSPQVEATVFILL